MAEEQKTATPITAKASFDLMPTRFNKDAAKGLVAVYLFDLAGEGGGKFQVEVRDQKLEVKEIRDGDEQLAANLTVKMTAADYLDMLSGKINGQVAFMSGRMRLVGDMRLAIRMQSLFQV